MKNDELTFKICREIYGITKADYDIVSRKFGVKKRNIFVIDSTVADREFKVPSDWLTAYRIALIIKEDAKVVLSVMSKLPREYARCINTVWYADIGEVTRKLKEDRG